MTCVVTPLKFSTQTVFEVMFDFVAACLDIPQIPDYCEDRIFLYH